MDNRGKEKRTRKRKVFRDFVNGTLLFGAFKMDLNDKLLLQS